MKTSFNCRHERTVTGTDMDGDFMICVHCGAYVNPFMLEQEKIIREKERPWEKENE